MSEEKMGKEPDKLILRILREVRKDVRVIKTDVGEIKRQIDSMRMKLGLRIGKLEEKVH
jgi:hypothetical protein